VRAEALQTVRRLEAWGRARNWSGSDQYDALNGTRLPRFLVETPLRRRIVIQLVKRSPFDLRPLLGIPPGQNAVSLAWAASAYALNGFLPEPEADRELRRALDTLERLRCRTYSEPCWGYHFDFQSRVFFYPKTEPNVIASVYAGMALCDAHERLGDPDLLERAYGVGRFLLARVPQTSDPPGAFFGYLVGDRSPIHNSNLHVCSLLARLHALTGDDRLAGAAREGVRWTTARQRDNGSWPYGERRGLEWVDSFHTGYVLDALDACLQAGLLDGSDALDRGLNFYRSRMFLPNGTPKYFEHQTYPIDMWSVAQAIQTLSIASRRDPELLAIAGQVFEFARTRMRTRDGLFAFQRRRMWANRTPHVRGVISPMMLALAHLLTRLEADAGAIPEPLAARHG
jgi:hypothetical protein